jgi:thymidylate kinase
MRSDAAPVRTGRSVVIEFVGIPGCGKTTLARHLVAGLRAAGVSACTMTGAGRARAARTPLGTRLCAVAPPRWHRALLWQAYVGAGRVHAISFAREHRRLLGHVLATQRGRRLPRRLRAHVLRWWLVHAGRRSFLAATAVPDDVLVVDDGFLHRAVTLHAGPSQAPVPEVVRQYVDLVPVPDLTVVVAADPETCAERIGRRGAWRHRPLGEAELRSFLANASRAVEHAVARARAAGWDVVEVDNHAQADVADTAAELTRQVLRSLDGARPRGIAGVRA